MRIGIDATALPPQPVGAGNYIIQLIRALSDLDVKDEFVIYAQRKGQVLINLPKHDRFEWIILEDRNPGFRLIWEQTLFPKLINETGVELLHSLHYTRPIFLPCASVVTFHDMTFFLYPELHTRIKQLFFPLAIRASARLADALITNSENTRRDAIRVLGIPPEKISATRLGVDPGFKPISDNGIKKVIAEKYSLPERFILYVGLIEPRKNLPMLIKAYKQYIDEGGNYHLVLVGNYGWMYEEVLKQIVDLELEREVHFTGYIPQEDLPLVYNLSSLFVYPTIYEGFGLPVLEAMACGVPVITTNVSSLPEIVGGAGILVPVDDVDALYRAIKSVLGDEDLQIEMIQKGISRASKFSWQQTAKLTYLVYQKAMRII